MYEAALRIERNFERILEDGEKGVVGKTTEEKLPQRTAYWEKAVAEAESILPEWRKACKKSAADAAAAKDDKQGLLYYRKRFDPGALFLTALVPFPGACADPISERLASYAHPIPRRCGVRPSGQKFRVL